MDTVIINRGKVMKNVVVFLFVLLISILLFFCPSCSVSNNTSIAPTDETSSALTIPIELLTPYALPTQQNEIPCAHGEHLFVPDHCCKCGYTPRTIDDDLVVGWFLFTNRQSIEYSPSVDPFDGIVYIPETYKQTIIKEVNMIMMRDEIEEIILPKTVSLIDITANQPTQNDTTTVKRIVIYGNDDLHIEHISDLQQLTDIVIDPNRKISCGNGCFRNCTSLSKVTLPSIEIIAQDMFENCYSLQDIVVPNTLKEISWGAFSGCSSLQAIHYLGTIEQWSCVEISKGIGNPQAITVYCSNGTASL